MTFTNDQPALANQLGIDPQLPDMENKELFSNELEDILKEHAETINSKTGGLYDARETVSFNQLFTTGDPQAFRLIYRKTFDLIDLVTDIGGSATVQFPHQINGLKQSFMIFASCGTTSLEFFTSVYPDVYADTDNIYFTNPHTQPLEKCVVVMEYTKD